MLRSFSFLCSLFFIVLLISACNVNRSETQLRPDLESIYFAEVPDAAFTIDRQRGIVSPINAAEFAAQADRELTPVFVLSENAELFAGEEKLISGESRITISEGRSLQVRSANGNMVTEFFLHLNENLPASYLLEEISFERDPSGRNPLSARIDLKSNVPTVSSATVLGAEPVHSPKSPMAESHELNVLGLYPGVLNEVEVLLSDQNGVEVRDTLLIETPVLPDFLPDIDIVLADEQQMEPGMHFSEVHIGNAGNFNSHPIIYDNNGEIRWYVDLSEHGRITWPIQFTDRGTFYAVFGVTLVEYDMMGNEVRRVVAEGNNMHHEVIEIPNGNFIIAVSRVGTQIEKNGEVIDSVEDFIIELDPQNGQIVREWDMGDLLDVERTDVVDGGGDWFHMNAIWYDESDGSLIISGRNQGLVKVSRENDLIWILAPHQGWAEAGRTGAGPDTRPFLLTAVDAVGTPYASDVQNGTAQAADFDWVWGQHTPMLLPNGNIMVFDNGTNRNFGNVPSDYSRAVEYRVDEQNGTVTQVWEYGKDLGQQAFSNIISDVDLLERTGNRLFAPGYINDGSGGSARVYEVSYPDNQVVFESVLTFKDQLSTGQGWGQIDIAYRAERVRLSN